MKDNTTLYLPYLFLKYFNFFRMMSIYNGRYSGKFTAGYTEQLQHTVVFFVILVLRTGMTPTCKITLNTNRYNRNYI